MTRTLPFGGGRGNVPLSGYCGIICRCVNKQGESRPRLSDHLQDSPRERAGDTILALQRWPYFLGAWLIIKAGAGEREREGIRTGSRNEEAFARRPVEGSITDNNPDVLQPPVRRDSLSLQCLQWPCDAQEMQTKCCGDARVILPGRWAGQERCSEGERRTTAEVFGVSCMERASSGTTVPASITPPKCGARTRVSHRNRKGCRPLAQSQK
jgi:hypothetical protein